MKPDLTYDEAYKLDKSRGGFYHHTLFGTDNKFGVFGTESGFCYASSFTDESEAKKEAARMNRDGGDR